MDFILHNSSVILKAFYWLSAVDFIQSKKIAKTKQKRKNATVHNEILIKIHLILGIII